MADEGLMYGEAEAGESVHEGDEGLMYGQAEAEGGVHEDDDTNLEALALDDTDTDTDTLNAESEKERHVKLAETEDDSETGQEDGGVQSPGVSEDDGNMRDIADLGIVAAEIGGDAKSDDDDHGTITDDYEADSEEPVTAFDSRRYSEVTGGLSEMSLTDTVICIGFGYALVYA
ncbi:hypothetical protein OHC33_008500 [Knufia fluminis]|uniref:Uncharacterized protein n=1 Tax=Knufia fluminis TaxID=191047 RepID=A0AAN8IJU5_9EURO|nr:hypothetical protein OHC33_008500 [Knufia fluminis]